MPLQEEYNMVAANSKELSMDASLNNAGCGKAKTLWGDMGGNGAENYSHSIDGSSEL